MHEHGLADRILETVLRHPDRPPSASPATITIQVSELGGLTEQALQANIDHVCEHHGLPPVGLRVEVVPFLADCRTCGTTVALDEKLVCPACGRDDIRMCGGETAIITACAYATGDSAG